MKTLESATITGQEKAAIAALVFGSGEKSLNTASTPRDIKAFCAVNFKSFVLTQAVIQRLIDRDILSYDVDKDELSLHPDVWELMDGNVDFWYKVLTTEGKIKDSVVTIKTATDVASKQTVDSTVVKQEKEVEDMSKDATKDKKVDLNTKEGRAAAKAKALAPTPKVEKARKEKPVDDGKMHTQLGYDGQPEEVPAYLYVNKVICECGNIRYCKNADAFQVKECKPCTIKNRRKRREANRAERRKSSPEYIAKMEAIAEKKAAREAEKAEKKAAREAEAVKRQKAKDAKAAALKAKTERDAKLKADAEAKAAKATAKIKK